MRMIRLFLSLLLFTSVAQANPYFYNATPNNFKIRITQPNGEKAEHDLSAGANGLGSVNCWMLDSVKTFPYEILDDMGSVIASGQGQNHMCYLLTPERKLIGAGSVSGRSPTPKACLVIDLTGHTKANFLGGTGVDAQRGLTFGKEFDRSKPFRFHPKEDSYWVELVDPQGNVHKAWGRFSPGYYAVIFVNRNGEYAIDFMGMIE